MVICCATKACNIKSMKVSAYACKPYFRQQRLSGMLSVETYRHNWRVELRHVEHEVHSNLTFTDLVTQPFPGLLPIG